MSFYSFKIPSVQYFNYCSPHPSRLSNISQQPSSVVCEGLFRYSSSAESKFLSVLESFNLFPTSFHISGLSNNVRHAILKNLNLIFIIKQFTTVFVHSWIVESKMLSLIGWFLFVVVEENIVFCFDKFNWCVPAEGKYFSEPCLKSCRLI